tara:strand:- start:566 stop:847 length:282 start_codon:yes stop_codon:yes gene_type:complete
MQRKTLTTTTTTRTTTTTTTTIVRDTDTNAIVDTRTDTRTDTTRDTTDRLHRDSPPSMGETFPPIGRRESLPDMDAIDTLTTSNRRASANASK